MDSLKTHLTKVRKIQTVITLATSFITDYDLTDGSSSRFSEAMTQRTFPAISHTRKSYWDRGEAIIYTTVRNQAKIETCYQNTAEKTQKETDLDCRTTWCDTHTSAFNPILLAHQRQAAQNKDTLATQKIQVSR